MTLKPVYIIPLLVEQPTWGGEYIAAFKGIVEPSITSKKIGQSFELAADSMITSESDVPFAFATATDLKHPTYSRTPADLRSLQSLIDENPEAVLGKKTLEKFGPKMSTLIKFTQAQNNSYQVHVKPGKEFGKWKAKPESWYFLEPGKATLGLAPGSAEKYKARCLEIDQFAQAQSVEVKAGKITLDTAKQNLHNFIEKDHPRRFVNTVNIAKDQVIDLSDGGIHHSWEMDPAVPNGNIVYEVQVDVQDEFCTLRSFDQGNMKGDGSVRPLTIEDYFKALNTDPEANIPENYQRELQHSQVGSASINELFSTPNYQTICYEFSGELPKEITTTSDSFHHIFVQGGEVEVKTEEKSYPVKKGFSLFIPASLQQYQIYAAEPCKVLLTTS